MSSPYVYSNNHHHQTPYYYHTPRIYTPFLPPSPSLPASPNHPYTVLPPVTPTTSHYVPFPTSGYDPDVHYAPWDPRQRRPSWHGPNDWLQPQHPGPYTRRHSFGNTSYPPRPYPQTQFFINPWINASAPRSDFFFDLGSTPYAPLRLFGPGQSSVLPVEELNEPATHPPITRMRIICELIPNWPIDLEYRQPNPPYSPYSPNQPSFQYPQLPPPPISLSDVLVATHQSLHRRITHVDWAGLNRHQEKDITNAYLTRCGLNEHEKAQGVKRVDFLLGRTRMVGIVRSGVEDGWEVMRLVLSNV
jgi:hypothetical protein